MHKRACFYDTCDARVKMCHIALLFINVTFIVLQLLWRHYDSLYSVFLLSINKEPIF